MLVTTELATIVGYDAFGKRAPAQAGLLAGFREVLGTFQLVAKHQIGPSVILVSMIFYYSF